MGVDDQVCVLVAHFVEWWVYRVGRSVMYVCRNITYFFVQKPIGKVKKKVLMSQNNVKVHLTIRKTICYKKNNLIFNYVSGIEEQSHKGLTFTIKTKKITPIIPKKSPTCRRRLPLEGITNIKRIFRRAEQQKHHTIHQIGHGRGDEDIKLAEILLANTFRRPWTMMIIVPDTNIAIATMMGALLHADGAFFAESTWL